MGTGFSGWMLGILRDHGLAGVVIFWLAVELVREKKRNRALVDNIINEKFKELKEKLMGNSQKLETLTSVIDAVLLKKRGR